MKTLHGYTADFLIKELNDEYIKLNTDQELVVRLLVDVFGIDTDSDIDKLFKA